MRIALGIEYHGANYHGWQTQKNLPSIQSSLEMAISKIADHPIKLHCAGRTDTGVHAIGQVAHFDTDAKRDMRAWTLGVNTHLPQDIAIRWAKLVDEHFHARFSAILREYRYIIYNHSIRSALTGTQATWYYHPLDVQTMQVAASYLIGEQDFSSFRSSECESLSPHRNMHAINVMRQEDFVTVSIRANAFLHHMVRNIVGVLLRIGAGFHEPEWMQQVLMAKDRRQAAETASPKGLYLHRVTYPAPYVFPEGYKTTFLGGFSL